MPIRGLTLPRQRERPFGVLATRRRFDAAISAFSA
jgi:hypothetical protein